MTRNEQEEGCFKQILLFLLGFVLVSVITSVAVLGLATVIEFIGRWHPSERIFKNLLYIFGSWALIHFIYILALSNTKQISEKSRWNVYKYIVKQLMLVIGAVAMVSLLSGLGALYFDRLFTLDGFIQAAIVVIIPALFGIFEGLKNKDSKGG